MFEPLTRVLRERREQTSRIRDIQIHAISEHESILRALESGDPSQAQRAMQSHMTQTLEDLQTYVLKTEFRNPAVGVTVPSGSTVAYGSEGWEVESLRAHTVLRQ